MKRIFAALLLLTLAAPALGQDKDKGHQAYLQGDYATALKEFRPLAEQGDADAQAFLGAMYYYGEGVPQDYAEAIRWYRKAAEQGDAADQVFLGGMYYHGRGVPQDYVKAHALYNIAAAQGASVGADLRDKVASKMTPADISKAQQLARECAEKDYKNCGF